MRLNCWENERKRFVTSVIEGRSSFSSKNELRIEDFSEFLVVGTLGQRETVTI